MRTESRWTAGKRDERVISRKAVRLGIRALGLFGNGDRIEKQTGKP